MSKSKKPENTAFKQQRLKSWQPLLTPASVIPAFFIIGLVFIPLGVVLHIASEKVVEVRFDYTKCSTDAQTTLQSPIEANGIDKWRFDPLSKVCEIQFKVTQEMAAPVYIYYRLTNFYQNNRKYVKSFDLKQLGGAATTRDDLCTPLGNVGGPVEVKVEGLTVNASANAVYYPCGLIANSLFSDSISDLSCVNSAFPFANNGCQPNGPVVKFPFPNDKIAWPSDASRYGISEYKNLPNLTTTVLPPPFWREAFPEFKDGYTQANFPNLANWTNFHVWMRTAGLPTFRKLYGVSQSNLLPAGTWSINITQNFAVSRFGGTKSIVLSTTSILGGKNIFLGSSYVIVGILCVVFGLAFLIRNSINPRKLGDHKLLSWNQEMRSDTTSLLASQ